jgi:hypothetical protein
MKDIMRPGTRQRSTLLRFAVMISVLAPSAGTAVAQETVLGAPLKRSPGPGQAFTLECVLTYVNPPENRGVTRTEWFTVYPNEKKFFSSKTETWSDLHEINENEIVFQRKVAHSRFGVHTRVNRTSGFYLDSYFCPQGYCDNLGGYEKIVQRGRCEKTTFKAPPRNKF